MKQKLLLTSALVASMSLVQAQEIATWKGFRKAAVTFSFDDNWSNQIDCVKKYFDPHGYKATFNIVTNWVSGGNSHGTSWSSWKEMADNGHEIASHTDSHSQDTPANECGSSKSTIESKIGNSCVTIAYPYCNKPSGGLDVYLSGRICDGQIASSSPKDFYNIGSIICGSSGINSANEFNSKMSQAKSTGGWVTFLIHGVDDGDYSPTSSSAISGAISNIANNDADYWCCTFAAATKYIKERNSAKASLKSSSSSSLTFTLTDGNSDNDLFDEALSLRYKNPGWSKVSGKQGSKAITASIKDGYIYFDAVPDAGDIVLSGDGSASGDTGSGDTGSGDTGSGDTGGGTTTPAATVDPCSKTDKYTGGTKVTSNGVKDVGNGYNYEIWRDGSSGSMTIFGGDADCAFKADWNNSGDFLARVGYYDGSCKKKYTDLGDITADYNYTKSGNGGGSYSYIGIYGWTKSPLIEYYIVDDSFTPSGGGMFWNASAKGTYTLDGDTYTLYVGQRTNAPSIEGDGKNFQQVFAKRNTYRSCGHISVSEHFKQWAAKGIEMGGLYDCKILCEVGGGQGSIEYTYATMSWKGQTGSAGGGSSTPATPAETEEPYKGAIAIPGTLECENYNKGGNGFGYKDTDDENEGGKYRNDGVDIVTSSTGYSVGYTASGEWLKYTINVEEAGEYNVGAYMANGSTDPEISLSVDGKKACSITGTGKGDWDTYTMATGKITLAKGEHTLVLNFENDYTNIDYIEFSKDAIGGGGSTTPGDDDDPDTPVTPVAGSGDFFDENGAFFGPSCYNGKMGTGAFYTGNYTSPFKTILGKTDAEIQAKLDKMWDHYFVGSNKVYYDKNDGTAYILDTGNNDVRSEGMSYGMMICVQTGHKTEFDKLWAFAKKNMLHTSGQWQGYFKWQCNPDGSAQDANCAPDGEMYFTTALLLAANRWGEKSYNDDAQYCLKNFWKGGNGSLFNETHNVITFQPYNCSDFSDPSYDLPAFVDLFALWSTTNNSKWATAASATRDHLYKSCNTSSGLFSDYNNFDGTPHGVSYNSNAEKYMYDAMRCAMNYGMDYYLFGTDAKRQTEMAKRIIDFFEKDGYSHARFNWDGSGAAETYTLGETGANAVACMALMNEESYASKVKTNLNKAWSAGLATGQYRYYDGLVHYLAMLHLCGSFKIWKEAPKDIKEVSAVNEYNNIKYTEATEIYELQDCELVKVKITVKDLQNVENIDANEVTIVPNPASTVIEIISDEAIKSVELIDMIGNKVLSTNESVISVATLPAGIYVATISTENAQIIKKVMIKR